MLENEKKNRAISDEEMNDVNGGIFLGIGNNLVYNESTGKRKRAKNAVLKGQDFKAQKLGDLGGLEDMMGSKVVSGGNDTVTGTGTGSGFESGSC